MLRTWWFKHGDGMEMGLDPGRFEVTYVHAWNIEVYGPYGYMRYMYWWLPGGFQHLKWCSHLIWIGFGFLWGGLLEILYGCWKYCSPSVMVPGVFGKWTGELRDLTFPPSSGLSGGVFLENDWMDVWWFVWLDGCYGGVLERVIIKILLKCSLGLRAGKKWYGWKLPRSGMGWMGFGMEYD